VIVIEIPNKCKGEIKFPSVQANIESAVRNEYAVKTKYWNTGTRTHEPIRQHTHTHTHTLAHSDIMG